MTGSPGSGSLDVRNSAMQYKAVSMTYAGAMGRHYSIHAMGGACGALRWRAVQWAILCHL